MDERETSLNGSEMDPPAQRTARDQRQESDSRFTALMFCKSSQAGVEKRRGLSELQGRVREYEDHKQPTSSCISGTGSNGNATASKDLGLQPTPDQALWKKPH